MLVEVAVGDAYGVSFEYCEVSFTRQHNDVVRFYPHAVHPGLLPGMYTDDAQMTLAIAEMLADGTEWTRKNIADKFVDCFKRDPRRGYAGQFYKLLCEVKDGDDFRAKIIAASEKSGAAMRTAPLGLVRDLKDGLEMCRIQGELTHGQTSAINAAQAVVAAVWHLMWGEGSKKNLDAFLEATVPHPGWPRWGEDYQGKVGLEGMRCVQAALTAVRHHDNLRDMLKACIDFTGDVDTVAAIAMGIASCSVDVRPNLPTALYEGLENGTYGREYIEALDARLHDKLVPH